MNMKRAFRYINIDKCVPGWFYSQAGEPSDPIGQLLHTLGYNYKYKLSKIPGMLPAKEISMAHDTNDYSRLEAITKDYLVKDISHYLYSKGIDARIMGLAVYHWEDNVKSGMGPKDAWEEAKQYAKWLESINSTCKDHKEFNCKICYPVGAAPWKMKDPSKYVPIFPDIPILTLEEITPKASTLTVIDSSSNKECF